MLPLRDKGAINTYSYSKNTFINSAIQGTRNNGSAAQLGSFSYQLMLIHLRHTHISSTSLPEAIFPLFHISSWYIISVYLLHNCN